MKKDKYNYDDDEDVIKMDPVYLEGKDGSIIEIKVQEPEIYREDFGYAWKRIN